MRSRVALLLFPLFLLAGCGEPVVVDTPVTHPGNPEAASAPEPARSTTLNVDAVSSSENPAVPAQVLGSQTEPAKPMHQHGIGTPPATMDMPMPDGGTKPPASATEKAIFICTMHPEIQSDKPGKCPICGMALIQKPDGDTK